MDAAQQTLLLLASLACWYVYQARTAEPEMRHCRHCGDWIYFAPGLPTRCPTCKKLSLI